MLIIRIIFEESLRVMHCVRFLLYCSLEVGLVLKYRITHNNVATVHRVA